jgi:hypothetical protein
MALMMRDYYIFNENTSKLSAISLDYDEFDKIFSEAHAYIDDAYSAHGD